MSILAAGDPGLFRVERYTYTFNADRTVSGTRFRTRNGQPQIEGARRDRGRRARSFRHRSGRRAP